MDPTQLIKETQKKANDLNALLMEATRQGLGVDVDKVLGISNHTVALQVQVSISIPVHKTALSSS